MKYHVKDLQSDIAPGQGRKALARWNGGPDQNALLWESSPCSLWGSVPDLSKGEKRILHMEGMIRDRENTAASAGWIDIETSAGLPQVKDLFLTGTRPLPTMNITCLCRCPVDNNFLIAAAGDHLLLLDARLSYNLQVLSCTRITFPVMSLVCCGNRLLALEKPAGRMIHLINCIPARQSLPVLVPASQIALPRAVAALAENDHLSVWGLTPQGEVYQIFIPGARAGVQPRALVPDRTMVVKARLGGSGSLLKSIAAYARGIYDALKRGWMPRRGWISNRGRFLSIAFDGQSFWTCRQRGSQQESHSLLQYNAEGNLTGSFPTHPSVSISSLNFSHSLLLLLDAKRGYMHQIYRGDTTEAIACAIPAGPRHPGFLPAGSPEAGGVYDLCLLYTGGEGRKAVHRYDPDKLRPLVGYVAVDGTIQDYFMDGFLMLAQYSPLLNGRSFGVDLSGPPSRKEDWIALFQEYFLPEANLHSLESCAGEVKRLAGRRETAIKVVLGIPTPDPRCRSWDENGLSLETDGNRLEATRWAMGDLARRWNDAGFRHLILTGFYYITEQGALNDPVLTAFPSLCREYQLHSYAIPGITSSWMTEFKRAGFNGVALQSSHAFWAPPGRPKRYLLKCAGHIARLYGMGVVIEIPYDVLSEEGAQRLRDYLGMARLQGWEGSFKAYFQSYNLIKTLAESDIPACRRLYDELYAASRVARGKKSPPAGGGSIPVDGLASWINRDGHTCLRINIEGHQGEFAVTGIVMEK